MNKKVPLILVRVALVILILCNMAMIFQFSHQNGERSNKTSTNVSQAVADATIKDFDKKPVEEQNQIVAQINPPLRKLAHMTEFGTLGALVFLLLITWRGELVWRYFAALGFTFLYACTDELHQRATEAGGPAFKDVMIDLSGALITCTLLLIIVYIVQKKRGTLAFPIKVTHIHMDGELPKKHFCIAVAADLHGEDWHRPFSLLRAQNPDMILIPGDLMDDDMLDDPDASGYEFLRACAQIAPTFYSLGNHEVACYHRGKPWLHPTPVPLSQEMITRIRATGVHFLDNDHVQADGLTVCGIGSGLNGLKNEPDREVLARFAGLSGYRILLCHHPEYFVPYIKDTGIELTVSGHAHGGQWRFFGRGVYAPGQGLFPKYTSGVIDGRCVISRGLSNHPIYPRLFNPREIVILHFDANSTGGQPK